MRLFDEDGFAALKKAQRNNEDLNKVKELRTVSVYHAVRNFIYTVSTIDSYFFFQINKNRVRTLVH